VEYLCAIDFLLGFFEDLGGVMHNDLHLNNIWIEPLANEKQLQLTCHGGATFTFSTRKIVKIFDFDFGSISPTDLNDNKVQSNTALETTWCIRFRQVQSDEKGTRLFIRFLVHLRVRSSKQPESLHG